MTNSQKISKLLVYLLIALVLASIYLNYRRSYILEDFSIENSELEEEVLIEQ